MKYMRVLYYIAACGFLLVGLLVAIKLICLTFGAIEPLLDAVLVWMQEHAIVGGLLCAIGFTVWIFADVCDEQRREEKSR